MLVSNLGAAAMGLLDMAIAAALLVSALLTYQNAIGRQFATSKRAAIAGAIAALLLGSRYCLTTVAQLI